MDGVINLDKPPRRPSASAMNRVRYLLGKSTKVGHAGTLDPFATGVLLLLVGKATKRCEELMGSPKQYEATLKLGVTTRTLDTEAPEIPFADGVVPDRDRIDATLLQFVGEIEQVPPAFSALKVDGKPAYALARKGRPVELEPRRVRVYGLEVMEYSWPLLRLRVDCGRGFYVRALARDIGQALGCGGYLTELRRTRVGEYRVEEGVQLDSLTSENVRAAIRP